MARTRMHLVLLVAIAMFTAGCISAPTPEWGSDAGEMQVTIEDNTAQITSDLGTEKYDETHTLIGCSQEEETSSKEIEITGMLISSTIYSEHTNANGLEQAVAAALVIDLMSWTDATLVEDGTGGRVAFKDWTSPLQPMERVGNKFADNEGSWIIIGVIPGSENVADNLNIVEEWHQAITITGHIVNEDDAYEFNPGCVLSQSINVGDAMVVTNIETEVGIVSLDGDSDDEWSLGDTDFFGGWTFIMIFLVVAGGGGFGLFIFSTMVVRKGATSTAKTLLGKEGFAKAVEMRKSLKKSKRDDAEEARDTRAVPKKDAYVSPTPTQMVQQEPVEDLGGFSLDSILSSAHTIGEPTGGGSSVIVSDEAKDMKVTSSNVVSGASEQYSSVTPSSYSVPSSNVVSQQSEPSTRSHFSSSMASQSKPSAPERPAKPVKRRTVKKRKAREPEPEPKRRAPTHSTPSIADDDFDDFSL